MPLKIDKVKNDINSRLNKLKKGSGKIKTAAEAEIIVKKLVEALEGIQELYDKLDKQQDTIIGKIKNSFNQLSTLIDEIENSKDVDEGKVKKTDVNKEQQKQERLDKIIQKVNETIIQIEASISDIEYKISDIVSDFSFVNNRIVEYRKAKSADERNVISRMTIELESVVRSDIKRIRNEVSWTRTSTLSFIASKKTDSKSIREQKEKIETSLSKIEFIIEKIKGKLLILGHLTEAICFTIINVFETEETQSIEDIKGKAEEAVRGVLTGEVKGTEEVIEKVKEQMRSVAEFEDFESLRLQKITETVREEKKQRIEEAFGEEGEGGVLFKVVQKLNLGNVFVNLLRRAKLVAFEIITSYFDISLVRGKENISKQVIKFIDQFDIKVKRIEILLDEYLGAAPFEADRIAEKLKNELVSLIEWIHLEAASIKGWSEKGAQLLYKDIFEQTEAIKKYRYEELKKVSWLGHLTEIMSSMSEMVLGGTTGGLFSPAERGVSEAINSITRVADLVSAHYKIISPLIQKAKEYKMMGLRSKSMLYMASATVLTVVASFNILSKITGELISKTYEASKQLGILSQATLNANTASEVLTIGLRSLGGALAGGAFPDEAAKIAEQVRQSLPDWFFYYRGAGELAESASRSMGSLEAMMERVPVSEILDFVSKAKGITRSLEPLSQTIETITKNYAWLKSNFKFTDQEIKFIQDSLGEVGDVMFLFSKNVQRDVEAFIQAKAKQLKELERFGVEAMKVIKTLMDMFDLDKVSQDDYSRNAVLFAKAGISYVEWQNSLFDPAARTRLEEKLQSTIIEMSKQIVSVAGRNVAALKALQQAYGLNMLSTTDLIRIARGGAPEIGIFRKAGEGELEGRTTRDIMNEWLSRFNSVELALRQIGSFIGEGIAKILGDTVVQQIIKTIWEYRAILVAIIGVLVFLRLLKPIKDNLTIIRNVLVNIAEWVRRRWGGPGGVIPGIPLGQDIGGITGGRYADIDREAKTVTQQAQKTTPLKIQTGFPEKPDVKFTTIEQPKGAVGMAEQPRMQRDIAMKQTTKAGQAVRGIVDLGGRIGVGATGRAIPNILSIIGVSSEVLTLFSNIIIPIIEGKNIQQTGEEVAKLLVVVGGVGLAMMMMYGVGKAMELIGNIPTPAIVKGVVNANIIMGSLLLAFLAMVGSIKLSVMIIGGEEGAEEIVDVMHTMLTGIVGTIVDVGKLVIENAGYLVVGGLTGVVLTIFNTLILPVMLQTAAIANAASLITPEGIQKIPLVIDVVKMTIKTMIDVGVYMIENRAFVFAAGVSAVVLGMFNTLVLPVMMQTAAISNIARLISEEGVEKLPLMAVMAERIVEALVRIGLTITIGFASGLVGAVGVALINLFNIVVMPIIMQSILITNIARAISLEGIERLPLITEMTKIIVRTLTEVGVILAQNVLNIAVGGAGVVLTTILNTILMPILAQSIAISNIANLISEEGVQKIPLITQMVRNIVNTLIETSKVLFENAGYIVVGALANPLMSLFNAVMMPILTQSIIISNIASGINREGVENIPLITKMLSNIITTLTEASGFVARNIINLAIGSVASSLMTFFNNFFMPVLSQAVMISKISASVSEEGVEKFPVVVGMISRIFEESMAMTRTLARSTTLANLLTNIGAGMVIGGVVSNIAGLAKELSKVKWNDLEYAEGVLNKYLGMLAKIKIAMTMQKDMIIESVRAEPFEISYEIVPKELNVNVSMGEDEIINRMVKVLESIDDKMNELKRLSENLRRAFR